MRDLTINGQIAISGDDEIDGQEYTDCRVTFDLYDRNDRKYSFIVDLPTPDAPEHMQTVDVWLVDSVVEVGDSPEDGFATFTPKLNTTGVVEDHKEPATTV